MLFPSHFLFCPVHRESKDTIINWATGVRVSKEIKLKKVKRKKELLEFRTTAMHAMEYFTHSMLPPCFFHAYTLH